MQKFEKTWQKTKVFSKIWKNLTKIKSFFKNLKKLDYNNKKEYNKYSRRKFYGENKKRKLSIYIKKL